MDWNRDQTEIWSVWWSSYAYSRWFGQQTLQVRSRFESKIFHQMFITGPVSQQNVINTNVMPLVHQLVPEVVSAKKATMTLPVQWIAPVQKFKCLTLVVEVWHPLRDWTELSYWELTPNKVPWRMIANGTSLTFHLELMSFSTTPAITMVIWLLVRQVWIAVVNTLRPTTWMLFAFLKVVGTLSRICQETFASLVWLTEIQIDLWFRNKLAFKKKIRVCTVFLAFL